MNSEEWTKLRAELEQADSLSNIKKVSTWLALDCPLPGPSAYKQELVKTYGQSYGIDILVETGTYLGQMVDFSRKHFNEVYSVELSDDLFKKAQDKFKKDKKIKLLHGDSSEMISRVLKKISKPAIFWLDAHYSEGVTAKGKLNTPIVQELEMIFRHNIKTHIILIDDSRIFNGKDDYPTIQSVISMVKKNYPSARVIDRHDVIRIQPDEQYIDV